MKNTDNTPKYDVVIALGKNWAPGQKRLSLESRMTALAAGKLLKEGVAKKAIFSGGYTAGSEMPSEAGAMLTHMGLSYKDQVYKVELEDESLDTSRNAENVKNSLGKKDKVLLLSIGYHFPRAKRIFDSYGVKADTISSEEVLEEGRMNDFLGNYHKSLRHRFETAKEVLILNPISLVDRKGIALRGLASFLRKSSDTA